MDGENHGKPFLRMDDLEGKPTIFGNIQLRLVVYPMIYLGFIHPMIYLGSLDTTFLGYPNRSFICDPASQRVGLHDCIAIR